MSEGEEYYLAVLAFAVLWAVLSAAKLIVSVREGNKSGAWFWAASFVWRPPWVLPTLSGGCYRAEA